MSRNSDTPAGKLDKGLNEIRQMTPSDGEIHDAAARVFRRLEEEHRKVTPFPAMDSAAASGATIEGCSGFRALIPAYLAGILQADWTLLLEDHMRECVDCRRTLEYARVGTPAHRTVNEPASTRNVRRFGLGSIAAVAALLALVAFGTNALRRLLWPIDAHAMAQTVEGSLYIVSGQETQAIAAGRRIERGQAVRAGSGSRAVLRLADGSLVEMSARAELTLADGRDGVKVQLRRGSVIVTAQKQGGARLYLETPDFAVSGAGTTFAVSAAPKGSRVSVIDGEARLLQNGQASVLSPGQQIATNASMETVSLRDEVAWSHDASARMELLGALLDLRADTRQRVAAAGMRFESDLKGMIPADAAVVASLPNVSEPLADAYTLFKKRVDESDTLRTWWLANTGAARGGGADEFADEFMGRMTRLGAYLGPEIILAFPARGRTESPIVLAGIRNADGALSAIQDDLGHMRGLGPNQGAGGIFIARNPSELEAAAVRSGDRPIVYVDRDWIAASSPRQIQQMAAFRDNPALNPFAQSPFGQRIDQAYAGGVGWLLAADLKKMADSGPLGANGAPNAPPGAILKWLGLDDADQLLVEQKTGAAGAEYRATLGFIHPRHGAAAWIGAPAPMGTLDFISPDAYGAAAVVTRNPALILDDIFQLVSSNTDAARTLEAFQREHHFDIRNDVAAPLGNEFLIALSGPILPTPAWRAVIEVNDAARLQNTIENAVASANRETAPNRAISLASEMLDGRRFYRLSMGEQPFEIHYAYWGGYLILGPKRTFVIEAIQAHDSGNSLARSPAFRAQLPDGHDMVSGLLYQNVQGLAASLPARGLSEVIAKTGPNTVYLYGEPDRIVLAGRGVLGLNGSGLAGLAGLAHLQELARGGAARGVLRK